MKNCRLAPVLVILCGLCAAVKSDLCSDDAPYKALVKKYTDAYIFINQTRNAAAENLPAYPGVYLKTLLGIGIQLDYFRAVHQGNVTIANECLDLGKQLNQLFTASGFNATDVFSASGYATGEDLYHSAIVAYGTALTEIFIQGTKDANVAYPTKYQSFIIRAAADTSALQLAVNITQNTPACLASAFDLGVVIELYFGVYTDNSTDCSATISVQPPSSVSTVAPVGVTTTPAAGVTTRPPSNNIGSTNMPTMMIGSAASVTAAPTTSTMASVTAYDGY